MNMLLPTTTILAKSIAISAAMQCAFRTKASVTLNLNPQNPNAQVFGGGRGKRRKPRVDGDGARTSVKIAGDPRP